MNLKDFEDDEEFRRILMTCVAEFQRGGGETMKLNDLEEVYLQKRLLEHMTELIEGLREKGWGVTVKPLGYAEQQIVDEEFKKMLMICLTEFREVVKRRLTTLGVEL